MRKTKLSKLISFLLCFLMVVTSVVQFPVIAGAEEKADAQLTILEWDPDFEEGEPIEETFITEGGETTLKVEGATGDVQWQFYAEEVDTWVSIYGETEETIVLKYAKVANMLNDNDETQIRCIQKNGDNVIESDAVDFELRPAEQRASFPMLRAVNPGNQQSDATSDELEVAAEGEVPDTYSVIINYVFENGAQAENSWTGTAAAGSEFKYTIKSPVVTGYTPDRAEVVFDVDEVTGPITETVTYYPAEVKYSVKHYQQKLNEDGYDLVKTTEEKGYTDSYVSNNLAEAFPGFMSLSYDPEIKIAADGSTVVEIYYDRLYYLMSFDLDGGYGTEPIYAQYGTKIENVATPTKAGYTFAGWSYNGKVVDKLPETMPAEKRTYTATWGNPQTVNYTVVYWKENANDNNYSFWGSEIKTATAGSVVNGSDNIPQSIHNNEKQYFTYFDAKTDKNVVIEGDGSSVINVYYTRNLYTIIFYTDSDDCALETHTHTDACYEVACGKQTHTHTNECELTCNTEVHVHDEDCICSKAEHTHTEACCTLSVHTEHTDECCTLEVHTEHTDECCTLSTTHTHSAVCYINKNNDGTEQTCSENHVVYNPTEGATYDHWFSDDTCVYHNGTWYRYGNVLNNTTCPGNHTHGDGCVYGDELHTHGDGNCVYSDELHTHGDGNCVYNDEAHTHGDGNCVCPETAHEHSDACYGNCTVHTHTDACKVLRCTKFVHTHNDGNCTRNSYSAYKSITAKYEADISAAWPTTSNISGLRGWSIEGNTNTTQTSKVVTMTSNLCDTSDSIRKATAVYSTSCLDHLYYMFESFDQSGPATATHIQRGTTWYDVSTVYSQDVNSSGGNWNAKTITGMNSGTVTYERLAGTNNNPTERNVYLYYTRVRSDLIFQNVDKEVKRQGNIMYEQPLANYKDSEGNLLSAFEPAYPNTLEPNAYEFDGWYTTPECYDGTEFDFSTATMPKDDLTLYAKWAPIKHTVKFYLDKNACEADSEENNTELREEIKVPHGSKVTPVPADPENGSYTFVGWFYMDGGTEKAFDFENMPVTEDMEVYGKWSSTVLMPYTIKYAVKNEDGTLTYIAPDTTGKALATTTKTFTAKAGDELNDGYKTGYFPQTNSHSLTIDIENASKNTYTFIYVPATELPYTVKYLEKGTEKVLHEEKHETTRDAVITEKFVPVQGYRPDAYQKRLVLSADEKQNVIIFWYETDTVHAPVQITHYIQNAEGDDYTVYQESTDLNGVIGQDYSSNIITITGYQFKEAKVDGTVTPPVAGVVTGNVSAKGLVIDFYYDRVEVPYEFKFLEQGTEKVLADPVTGSARYGAQVTENAEVIPGYTCNDDSLSMRIQLEDGTDAVNNVKIFYYNEIKATINYVVVAEGNGTVSRASETVNVLTQDAAGSTAREDNDYYEFDGWYTNAECTDPVNPDWLSGENDQIIDPQPTKDYDTTANEVIGYESATYYAKFVEKEVSLNYEVVGPAGCGTVSPEDEALAVLSGKANGSTANTSGKIFKFVGWYADAACETLLSTDAEYVPTKEDDAAWVDGTTYYAKFDYNPTKLTITKEGIISTDHDNDRNDEKAEKQTVMFKITGPDYEQTVAICGNNSVVIDGLVVGDEYTITEITNWSWRYAPEQSSYKITLEPDIAKNAVVVKNKRIVKNDTNDNWKWLNGGAYAENGFGKVSE